MPLEYFFKGDILINMKKEVIKNDIIIFEKLKNENIKLQKEITAASKLSVRELEAIAEKLKKEMSENNRKVWNIVSSYSIIRNS